MTSLGNTLIKRIYEPTSLSVHRPMTSPKVEPCSVISGLLSVRRSTLDVENTSTPMPESADVSSLSKKVEYKMKISPYYKNITNAKDYVFLGSCNMIVSSDMGITLDKHGQLTLIKGRCQNLSKSWLNKYKNKKYNKYYSIDSLHDEHNIKFDTLYLNAEGYLTGKDKDSDCLYTINIEKNTSQYSSTEVEDTVCLSLIEQNERYTMDSEKIFSYLDKKGNTVRLSLKNDSIYLHEYENKYKLYNYELMDYQFKSCLNKKYKIKSVKPAKNKLQIEAVYKDKKRIFYLDPNNFCTYTLKIRGLSHKPPQSMTTTFGSDIHEWSTSGQPFSSKRRANFSSKYIPIVSTLIDNFRFHVKKAKKNHNCGKKSKAACHLLKSIDPGFEAIVSTTRHLKKSAINQHDDNKKNVINEHLLRARQGYSLLLKELPDIIAPKTSFAEGLLILLKNVKPDEPITLDLENTFSSFINFLHTGMPFHYGWFAGLKLSISKTHSLQLSKDKDGFIHLYFKSKTNKSVDVLAGTGQGLESGKLHSNNINFLSVMPFEVNLILSACKNKETNISFTMSEDDFIIFMNQDSTPPLFDNRQKEIIESAIINIFNNYQGALSLDVKMTELRAMIGIMSDNNHINYLAPRLSSALTFNTEIFSLSKKTAQKISTNDKILVPPKIETTLNMLTATAGTSTGVKVILNPYISDDNGNLNFRTSLTEDNKVEKTTTKPLYKIILPKKRAHSLKSTDAINAEIIIKIRNTLNDISPNCTISRTIKKLHQLKTIRALNKKPTPLHRKLINRCRRKMSSSHQGFNNLLNEQRYKEDFIDMINTLQSHAVSKERSNINKSITYYFDANYELNNSFSAQLHSLRENFSTLIDEQQPISTEMQRIKLEQLYQSIKHFQDTAMYRLKTIDVKSIGRLSKIKTSLINVIVNFSSEKTISYNQDLGTISFEYKKEDESTLQNIRGHYNVIF